MVAVITRISVLLCIITCSFYSSIFGQTKIAGSVSDSLDKPIPYAQIILRQPGGNALIAYALCDSIGDYTLEASESGQFELVVKALSYESKHYSIVIQEEYWDSVIIQDVVLKDKPIVFDEVIVRSERSISVKGDTVSYNVADFLHGNETVVEDLLQRLPGIEVDNEGTIRFAGKEIEKVMVGDTDIFGKGYSMITKNLDAHLIDKVQALQHYSDNPELKGLEKSDKIALNLDLKKGAKTSLLGNATLGYNSSNNYEGRVALISIEKKWKHYSFFNSNSLGYDPLGDIGQFLDSERGDQEEIGIFDLSIDPLTDLKEAGPELDDRRIRFNNSGLASYNVIYNPGKKIQIKGLSFATFEKDRYIRDGMYSYIAGNTSVVDKESYALTNRIKNGFAQIETSFNATENSKFQYNGLIRHQNGDAGSKIVFNEVVSDELLDNNNREITHSLDYTNRLNKKNALLVSGKYRDTNLSERFAANPLLPTELFVSSRQSYDVKQNNDISYQSFNLQSKTITKLHPDFILEIRGGTEIIGINTQTELLHERDSTIEMNNGDFLNDKTFAGHSLYAGAKGRYDFGSLSAFGAVVINQLAYKTKNSIQADKNAKSFKYLEPKLGLEWQLDSKNTIQTSYLYNATSTSLFDLMDGFLFAGERTFVRGLGTYEVFRGHNYLFNYTYGGWVDWFLINTTILYNKTKDHFSSKNIITPDFKLMSKRRGDVQGLFHFNLATDVYIRAVKNNIKARVNYSSTSSSGNMVNGNLYSFQSDYSTVDFEIRSVFKGLFNYIIGSSWMYQRTALGSRQTHIDQLQFLDLYFDFSKKIELQLFAEKFKFGGLEKQQNWYFLDGILNYDIKPNKWEMKAEARNLLNNQQFHKYSLTDMGAESTAHKIVSRYFLLGLHYRF